MTDREANSMWRKMDLPTYYGAPAVTETTRDRQDEQIGEEGPVVDDRDDIETRQTKCLGNLMDHSKIVKTYADGIKVVQLCMTKSDRKKTKQLFICRFIASGALPCVIQSLMQCPIDDEVHMISRLPKVSKPASSGFWFVIGYQPAMPGLGKALHSLIADRSFSSIWISVFPPKRS